MGFLEEGTAGTNFYQDWDELKTHMQCASQRERQETQAALKMGGGVGVPVPARVQRMEKLLGVGEITWKGRD